MGWMIPKEEAGVLLPVGLGSDGFEASKVTVLLGQSLAQ